MLSNDEQKSREFYRLLDEAFAMLEDSAFDLEAEIKEILKGIVEFSPLRRFP